MANLDVVAVDTTLRERWLRTVCAPAADGAGSLRPTTPPVVVYRHDITPERATPGPMRGRRYRTLQELDLARGSLSRTQREVERLWLAMQALQTEIGETEAKLAESDAQIEAQQRSVDEILLARENARGALAHHQRQAMEASTRQVDATERHEQVLRSLGAFENATARLTAYDEWSQHVQIDEGGWSSAHVDRLRDARAALDVAIALDSMTDVRIGRLARTMLTSLDAALAGEGTVAPAAAALLQALDDAVVARDEARAQMLTLEEDRDAALAHIQALEQERANLFAETSAGPGVELLEAIEVAYDESRPSEGRGFGSRRRKDVQTASTNLDELLAQAGFATYLDFRVAMSHGFNHPERKLELKQLDDRIAAALDTLAELENEAALRRAEADQPLREVHEQVVAYLGSAVTDVGIALRSRQVPPQLPAELLDALRAEIARHRDQVTIELNQIRDLAAAATDAEREVANANATYARVQRRALVAVNELEANRVALRAAREGLQQLTSSLATYGVELEHARRAQSLAEDEVGRRLLDSEETRRALRDIASGALPQLDDSAQHELERVQALLAIQLKSGDATTTFVFDDAFSELDAAVSLRLLSGLDRGEHVVTYLTDDPLVLAWAQGPSRAHE